MTNANTTKDQSNDQTAKRRPTKRLVQEKSYYKYDAAGRAVRASENVEITSGWDETGKESGKAYISWAHTTIPVLPDIDGKITLRTFEITYSEE